MTKRPVSKNRIRSGKKCRASFDEKALTVLADLLNRSTQSAGRALDDALRETQRSNRRIEAMEKKALRPAKRVLNTVERELLDSFSKVVERQFAAMARRVDQTNRRLDKLFLHLDRLKAKGRASPAYAPDNRPITRQQLRAIRKRVKQELGTSLKRMKVSRRLF